MKKQKTKKVPQLSLVENSDYFFRDMEMFRPNMEEASDMIDPDTYTYTYSKQKEIESQ